MIYDFLRFLLPRLFRLLWRCEARGAENIPRAGGVIIAANHMSNWDPPIVASFAPRYVHFMAKQELFEVPVFGWVIRRLHAFPVKRGASDRAAIKNAIQILSDGHCLGLFPEGTRSKDGELKKPEPGIALIAAKAGVSVVPAALVGTNRIFSQGCFFPRVAIVYGAPISMPEGAAGKTALLEFSERIMTEINRLRMDAAQEIK